MVGVSGEMMLECCLDWRTEFCDSEHEYCAPRPGRTRSFSDRVTTRSFSRSRLVLSSVGSVAWATGGLSIPIDRVASIDPIWVVVDDDATTLVASSVETPRLRAEYELDDLGFSIESAPWHEPDAHERVIERLTGQSLKDCLGESVECGVNVVADLVTARRASSSAATIACGGFAIPSWWVRAYVSCSWWWSSRVAKVCTSH
jgi:hypothetical protein